MSASQRAMWDRMSGGRAPLSRPPSIVCVIKSRRIAFTQLIGGGIAPANALLDWPHVPGEEPTFAYYASDRSQASIAYKRADGAFTTSPILAAEVANRTATRIELAHGTVLEIGTADNASVRGRTLAGAAIDEACYIPDLTSLLAALRPALATTGGTLWLFSTPRGADGPVYDLHRRYFGVENPDVLVIEAHVEDFNPTLPPEFVQRELQLDPINAAAEWLCQFIAGLTSMFDAPLVDDNTRSEPRELPRMATLRDGTPLRYHAGLDVSGGRGDAAAVAVAHRDGDRIVVDGCRRYPAPHDPAQVAAQVAEFLAGYGLASATADQYGASLATVLYAQAGVTLLPAPDSRSDCYLRLLPLLTTARCELPPDPQLRTELLGLERRTRSSGKDIVDHRPNGTDDVANSVALAATTAARLDNSGIGVTATYSDQSLSLASELGPIRWREIDRL